MRAVLYARVSTTDKGQEVENQLHQLREFCQRQGWTLIHEYMDHETGGSPDRSQFRKMLSDGGRHSFDVLVFWALDRFSREGVLPTLQYLNQLTSYGVGYRSYTEPYLDSCGIFKDAVVAIIATIAKQERLRMSERVLAGLERARREGKVLGRRRCDPNVETIRARRAEGATWDAIAAEMQVSRATAVRAFTASQKPLSDAVR
jgi:DNA invertase Pin-like site-specific DNA recombinase